MRILQIASGDFFSTYGGGQVYVKNIVDTMISSGEDIVVVSTHEGVESGISEKKYREIPLIEISNSEYLEDAIKLAKPDVIHAHSMKAEVCRIVKKLKIPVVVTSHHGGILCPAGTLLNCKDEICHTKVNHKNCLPCVLRNVRTGLKLWYPFVRYLPENRYISLGEKLKDKSFIPFITPVGSAALQIKNKKEDWNAIISGCSLMVAPCNEIANAMVLNGLYKSKVRVIPHGIPLPADRTQFPPVINGNVKFYYVGRICYVKGIHILLEAFNAVDNPDIELHLIGGAGNKFEAKYLSNLHSKFADDKRIIWHGKVSPETIYDHTRNYHVSISSSYMEAFGLNIAEALALGKPVLSTRCGGGEMQIKDGVNGWLVPINDSKALTEKIGWIASNYNILPSMSDNCHTISIEEHCSQLLKVYKEAQAMSRGDGESVSRGVDSMTN